MGAIDINKTSFNIIIHIIIGGCNDKMYGKICQIFLDEICLWISVDGGTEMKRFHLSKYVLLVLVAAFLLTGGVLALEPCDRANKLLNATLYDDARANYTDLLNQTPDLPCARAGILAVQNARANKSYELGRAYENASQVDEAKGAYLDALKNNSTFIDAQEALARLNGGILTLAYSWYLWLRSALEIIVAVAIVLIAITLIILIAIVKIYPWIKGFKRPGLDIGDFDKGATDLEISKGLGAMVQEKYIMLGQEGSMRVNLVEGPLVKLDFPADVNVSTFNVTSYFKFVFELINWLFPPRVITLSGHLQKPGSCGSGITVSLVDSLTKKILGSCTFWQNEMDLETISKTAEESTDPTSYYNLAEPIAIWALFELGKFSKKDEFTMMGTDDWKSYAYFKSGVRWYQEGKSEKAHQLYVESLGSNMNNWGTLLNLGRMEMEEGQYPHAFERLKMVKEKTISDEAGRQKSEDFPGNSIWYLASYSLALTYCYLYKRYYSNLTKAKKETENLIKKIDKSGDVIQKNGEVVKCNLSMFEYEEKTLLETIQKAIDDLQTAVFLSPSKTEEEIEIDQLYSIKNKVKKLVETNREALIARQKNDNNILKIKLSERRTLADEIIKEQPDNKSALFNFIISQAVKESKDLVDAIQKALGLPMAEREAKRLADTIQEAIDAQKRNEDQVLKDDLYKAKELMETVNEVINPQVDINEVIDQQRNKNQVLEDGLSNAKKQADELVKTVNKVITLQQKNQEKFTSKVKKLLYKLGEMIQKAIWPRQKNDEKELKESLESLYPIAFIMYVDTLLYANNYRMAISKIKRIEPSSLTYRGRYNLACYYSIIGEKGYLFSWDEIPGDTESLIDFLKQEYNIGVVKTSKIRKTDGDKTIEVFGETNHLLLSLKEETKVNLDIDDGRTDEFIAKNENGKLNIYRNDEKTKTESGKRNAYRESLRHLEYALERGGSIVEWAKKDPDLDGVREYEGTKEDFAKLIKKYQGTPDSTDLLPLAGIAIIKEAYARQLKEQEIVSHCDLILKADTPQSQEALAKDLGISDTLLRRWALLADLMRIVGDTKNVNLLEASDNGSIEALQNVSDPGGLTNLLNQVNKAQFLVEQSPSFETVQQWVRDARNIKRKVS